MKAVADAVKRIVGGVLRSAKVAESAHRPFPDSVRSGLERFDGQDVTGHDGIMHAIEPRPAANSAGAPPPSVDLNAMSRNVHPHRDVPVVTGRDLIDNLDYLGIQARSNDADVFRNQDDSLAEIAAAQGFHGPPSIVSEEELRNIVASGGVPLYRGFRNGHYVNEFMSGKYHAGLGMSPNLGNGIYATTSDRQAAITYARGNPDLLVRMALKPDSFTTTLAELRTSQRRELNKVEAELKRLSKMEQTPEMAEQQESLRARSDVLKDVGRYAAVRGVDAYKMEEVGVRDGEDTWVILNRTSLAAQG
ncbi:hypothetical protein [Nocardia gamkensis]|uniref:hypothetical protein n=1 Tax=Nocardia gamkensis TaxID=352869 RepID=UPI0037CA334A